MVELGLQAVAVAVFDEDLDALPGVLRYSLRFRRTCREENEGCYHEKFHLPTIEGTAR